MALFSQPTSYSRTDRQADSSFMACAWMAEKIKLLKGQGTLFTGNTTVL